MVKPASQASNNKQKALVAYQQKNFHEAKRLLEKVCKQDRHDKEAWLLLGIASGQLGKYAKAEQAFRHLIILSPHSAGAYNNLGLVLEAQNKVVPALNAFKQALELEPMNADAHYNMANSLVTQGQLKDAVKHYQQVLKVQPQNYATLINLGDVLQTQKSYSEAEQAFTQAIELFPGNAEAHYNLANVLKAQGSLAAAAEKYEQALKLKPEYRDAWKNLGNVLLAQGLVNEAIEKYRKLLERQPEMAGIFSSIIFTKNYLAATSLQPLFEQHREYDKRYATLLLQRGTQYPNRCNEGRKLRIAYVSADFHEHSVAYFFEPLIQHHNPDMFETFCYSNSCKCDAVTERLKGFSQHWRDIANLSDKQVIAKIRTDKIDILIDLAGHTANNRLPVFAQKPVPIQVTWLGYPNTTGLAAMDYRMTDINADPVGQEAYHTETLYRLENGFLCYRPADDCPEVVALPSSKTGYITFGSFNNFAKTTDAVLELWARLLKTVPESRLLLKNGALRELKVCQRVIDVFKQCGIEQNRLELIGWLDNKSDHLKLYGKVDIGLDTFPYNGTTTTCEAMWMGVPVITLCGDRHAARVGNSLLHQVGLQELIAYTEDEYIEIAKKLASNTAYLQELRFDMRQRMLNSSLTDRQGFTQHMESAFQHMWQTWCQSQSANRQID